MKIQVGLEFPHLRNFTSWWIYLRNKCVNLCSNDTMGTTNILRTTIHRHSKYQEKFNNVKEGKKSGPEITYGRTHSYRSSAFELSRFHCIYILTKFGSDWFIFVDARLLTRKLWTDGHRQMVSDHNSSLSTTCSGKLKSFKTFQSSLFFTKWQGFDTFPISKHYRAMLNVF